MRFNKKLLPLFLLLLLGIIWGSGYSIARYAMTHGVPPLGYSFWQSLGPAIVLLIVALFEKKIRFNFQYLRYIVIAGLLGIALPNSTMYFAAAHLPSGILGVIVNTVPIMMYPLALLFRQEYFRAPRLIGVVFGMLGILLIVFPAHLPSFSLYWGLVTLLSPFCFALCAIYGVYDRPPAASSLQLATGMLIVSAFILLPFILVNHEFYPITSFSRPNLAVILEIILSSIGYILFFQLLKMAGAVYYSLVGTVVSLTGLFWSFIVFGEKPSLAACFAVILIILAIFMISLFPAKK
jgi:drug/metabolite transporter (DMT)-like permease